MSTSPDIFETTAALIEIKEREAQWSQKLEEANTEAENIVNEARLRVKETESSLIAQAVEEAKKRLDENIVKAEDEAQEILIEAREKCKIEHKKASKRMQKASGYIVERVAG